MATYFIARHGRTSWNMLHRIQGQRDIPLSQSGRQQALELAHRLAGTHFDRIVSSHLSRALETASIIATERSMQVEIYPEFRERCYGIIEGTTGGRYDRFFSASVEDERRFAPAGAESSHEVYARLLSGFKAVDGGPNERILLVTHAGVMHCLLRLAFPARFSALVEEEIGNTAILILSASCQKTVSFKSLAEGDPLHKGENLAQLATYSR